MTTDATPAPWTGGPAPRPKVLLQGLASVVLALALLGLSLLGEVPFAIGLVVVQVLLVLGLLALVDAPSAQGIFVIALAVLLAADAVVVADDGDLGGLAGVLGLALVASFVHQLARRDRSRVTESLADCLVAVGLVASAACLLGLRLQDGGREAMTVVLAAAAAALVAGRLGDRVAPRPALAVGATRGVPGLVLALGAGAAAASLVAGDSGQVAGVNGALLGLAVAAAVAAGDLAVDLGAAELLEGRRDARRVAALRPAALLLPMAALGPVAFVAGRLVLA